MFKLYFTILLILASWHSTEAVLDTYAIVAPNVKFYVFQPNSILPKFTFTGTGADKTILAAYCPSTVKITWVVHGWTEGWVTSTVWLPRIVANFLKTSDGCVIVMDYSFYSAYGKGYGEITERYPWLRDVLTNTMKLFGYYNRFFCFGFSFGARLLQGAGKQLANENRGVPVIPRMDLCEPAGPSFDGDSKYVNATTAAMLVTCINTNIGGYGTSLMDCHINFRMGRCGKWQDGQGPAPRGSHGMCPFLYNFAFTFDFKSCSYFDNECNIPLRPVNATCKQNMIMGFRNKMFCNGDVIIPTAKCPPFVFNGTLNNYPLLKTACPTDY